jgi:hypothetical protein
MAAVDTDNAGYAFTLEALRVAWPFSPSAPPLVLAAPLPLCLAAGSIALYAVLLLGVFPALLAPRSLPPARSVEVVAQWHHGALFLYSLVCFLAMLGYLVASGELSLAGTSPAFFCAPLASPALRLLSLTFTASKIWEWGDTAVLVARGKSAAQIGFLHTYHHATTFALFLLVVNFPGTEKCGLLLNGFVHTLMYFHYAFRLPTWARPLITAAQIVQLVYVTWSWWVIPRLCPAYAGFPERHPLEFAAPFGMVPVYLAFFLEFFARTYLCGKRKERAGSSKSAKEE